MKTDAPWEVALNKFLAPLKKQRHIIGALVSGSHAIGTQTFNSDIDIHLILARGTKWRERGNTYVNNFLIEYFMNSIKQIEQYRKDDFKNCCRIDARMFALGKIIFDKTGALKRLQDDARRELEIPFKKPSASGVELGKYSIWDELDNLDALRKQKSPLYSYCHKLLLQRIIEVYRKYLLVDVGATSKLYRYFTQEDFRKKYSLPEFPDRKFTKLFLACLGDDNYLSIKRLVDHTLGEMGGLKVAGWKVRTKSV